MVVSFGPFGERRRPMLLRKAGKSGARRARSVEAGPVLFMAVLGSVAFLLWQAQRRHRRPAGALGAKAAPQSPGPDSLIRPPPNAGDMFRETGADRDDLALAEAWSVPSYPGVTLTGAYRAAMAVHLGRPSELRRIAIEMRSEGKDSEAGLLNNYALLLERSSSSRARVVGEVMRMLQAASAERNSAAAESLVAQRARPARGGSETQPGGPPVAPAREGDASDDVPLVPMPVLPIGEKRRAG
jgi:hypothetical protein